MTSLTNFSTTFSTPMTSTLTATKPQTSLSLTDEQRAHISELIVERYLDNMDSRDLEDFFRDIQRSYYKEYDDEELTNELADLFDEEEFNEAVNFGL